DAVERNAEAALADARPKPAATARPALPPVIQAELSAASDAQALAYLSALEASRARLRDAVKAYRASTSQPGGSSLAHATAARALREQIDDAQSTIEAITPPLALAQAHNSYLTGLEIERQALEDM